MPGSYVEGLAPGGIITATLTRSPAIRSTKKACGRTDPATTGREVDTVPLRHPDKSASTTSDPVLCIAPLYRGVEQRVKLAGYNHAVKSIPLPPLLPTPKKVRSFRGSFDLRCGLPIVLAPRSTDGDLATALVLQKGVLRDSGIEWAGETHARADRQRTTMSRISSNGRGQSYRLE